VDNNKLVGWYGRVLLVALAIEVALPVLFWHENTSRLETIIGVICALAVAVGVWGEIHFGEKASDAADELRSEADRQVAEAMKQSGEAHERAAEANLKAEREQTERKKLEAWSAPRNLFQRELDLIGDRLKEFQPMEVVVILRQDATEEMGEFARAVKHALGGFAGWSVFDATYDGARRKADLGVVGGPSVDQVAHLAARHLMEVFGEIGFRVSDDSGRPRERITPRQAEAGTARLWLFIGEHKRGY
jgi:hypothetical protein